MVQTNYPECVITSRKEKFLKPTSCRKLLKSQVFGINCNAQQVSNTVDMGTYCSSSLVTAHFLICAASVTDFGSPWGELVSPLRLFSGFVRDLLICC